MEGDKEGFELGFFEGVLVESEEGEADGNLWDCGYRPE
jgi:hypothetical protein